MAELLPLPRTPRTPEPLWRETLGELLRRIRQARGERLVDTAARAGVSPQYLSEVERGRKEPSSEMIAAIAGALDLTLLDLTAAIAVDLGAASAAPLPAAPARGALVLAA
jgi:transcriptional regulator with XRE-family HTH domain